MGELLVLEGKQLRADTNERRFEDRIMANERLMSRKVRLSEMQMDQMFTFVDEVANRFEQHSQQSLDRLREKIVEFLLLVSKEEEVKGDPARLR